MNNPSAALKGSVVRGYFQYLGTTRVAALRESKSERLRAMCDRPPLVTEWVDATDAYAILEAVGERWGAEDRFTKMSNSAANSNVLVLLRPMIRGLFAMFGANPATIFRHIDRFLVDHHLGAIGCPRLPRRHHCPEPSR